MKQTRAGTLTQWGQVDVTLIKRIMTGEETRQHRGRSPLVRGAATIGLSGQTRQLKEVTQEVALLQAELGRGPDGSARPGHEEGEGLE